jgi:hypothetical protein
MILKKTTLDLRKTRLLAGFSGILAKTSRFFEKLTK